MTDNGGVRYSYQPDAHFPDVTRITVISEEYGLTFEKYNLYKNGVDIILQDDGRTLKIFPSLRLKENDE